MCASWRNSTKQQYHTYLKRWKAFTERKNINMHHAPVEMVLEFLRELFDGLGLGYSAINTARSALASIVTLKDTMHTLGSHPLISRFMKGIFNLRPPRPRYRGIWDVKVVLDHLRKLSPANGLSLKQLTQKLVMLLALVSAQRVQTLHLFHLDNISFTNDLAHIAVCELFVCTSSCAVT